MTLLEDRDEHARYKQILKEMENALKNKEVDVEISKVVIGHLRTKVALLFAKLPKEVKEGEKKADEVEASVKEAAISAGVKQ